MPEEVSKALQVLAQFCIEQDSCSDCPIKEMCGKQPSELIDLD